MCSQGERSTWRYATVRPAVGARFQLSRQTRDAKSPSNIFLTTRHHALDVPRSLHTLLSPRCGARFIAAPFCSAAARSAAAAAARADIIARAASIHNKAGRSDARLRGQAHKRQRTRRTAPKQGGERPSRSRTRQRRCRHKRPNRGRKRRTRSRRYSGCGFGSR